MLSPVLGAYALPDIRAVLYTRNDTDASLRLTVMYIVLFLRYNIVLDLTRDLSGVLSFLLQR